ncbi:MAG: SAP domain-containing protein [Candidatus Poseidoniales archaeon]
MTEEKTRIEIHDSVVMGDVNQHVLNAECPSCSTSNVKVMKCQEIQCGKRFCELCHPECRYSKGSSFRFDSGKGLGPFCSKCIRGKRDTEEREREQKEREREQVARVRERAERERVQIKHRKEKEKERKREEAGIVQRTREAKEREEREREEREREERERPQREREERERERLQRERESEEREREEREEREREERERLQREGDEKDSSLWKEAADHSSSRNKVYRKRLMYSLILGFLVGVPLELSEMMIGSFVMVTLCCFYPLYLITMIIICGQTGTRKHYVKLSNQSNRMHKYTEMVDQLSFLTVAELRDKLSDVGLPVDGRIKAELITRLAEYLTENNN